MSVSDDIPTISVTTNPEFTTMVTTYLQLSADGRLRREAECVADLRVAGTTWH